MPIVARLCCRNGCWWWVIGMGNVEFFSDGVFGTLADAHADADRFAGADLIKSVSDWFRPTEAVP